MGALCISCKDQVAYDRAVNYAEAQLQKVHADYKAFCQQGGKPIPELSVKVSRQGVFDSAQSPGGDANDRGERPPNAPSDEEIERLIEERNEARKSANYKRANEVRETLKAQGVVLMDEKGAKGNNLKG